MIITEESATNNYKESRFNGYPCAQKILTYLFSTPRYSMPYALGIGFDLSTLIFKVKGSAEEEEAIRDAEQQITTVCSGDDVSVKLERSGTTIMNMQITFGSASGENQSIEIPISYTSSEYRVIYDDITVL